jgi:hypothetical protein
MKNESTYRIIVVVLLAGILAVQCAVLIRIPKPITAADFQKNGLTQAQRNSLALKIPLARVSSAVDVDVQNPSLDVNVENTSLDVDVQNSSLDVDVQNTPIEVEGTVRVEQ